MHSSEGYEDVQFLAGSPGRHDVLATLAAEPLRPADLTDRVDVTRTTVQRVLAGFAERGWVRKRGRRYEPTPSGRRMLEAYEATLEAADRSRELAPLLEHLGPVADELPEAALTAGEVTAAGDTDPLAAVDRVVARLRAATGSSLLVVSPVVAETFNRVAADLLAAATEMQMVIDERVLEASAESYPEALARAREVDDIDVVVHPEALALGIVVDPEWACLCAYDDDRNLRAVLESDAPEVREWAREYVNGLKGRARSLRVIVNGDT
ncbi:MAG: helix-turn-helix transcriptional regulator [Halolamina sp.]